MNHTELLHLLKQTNQFEPYADVCTSEVVCAIEALQAERETILQQLAEAQALIEASRKQKAVGWLVDFENGEQELHFHDLNNSLGETQAALYAAPVVADDVLKDAQRYRYLFAANQVYSQFARVYKGWDGSGGKEGFDAAIDAAMGGAND
jgi:hypothetical protein